MTSKRITHGLIKACLAAGREIMALYGKDIEPKRKADNSPVTQADERAEEIVLKALGALAPDIPVISEEAASRGHIPEIANRFFLVDPLDGTREFLKQNGEFTVNIALIEDGRPIIGAIYAPAKSRLFWNEDGSSAYEINIDPDQDWPGIQAPHQLHTRGMSAQGLIAITSRSHKAPGEHAALKNFDITSTKTAGSSLKFCLIAAQEADLYPREGRTMEWDIAAGHAILAAAGGCVITDDGKELGYGKKQDGFANPHFLARGWR